MLARRLPEASVVELIEQAYIRSANQLSAKAACDLLAIDTRVERLSG